MTIHNIHRDYTVSGYMGRTHGEDNSFDAAMTLLYSAEPYHLNDACGFNDIAIIPAYYNDRRGYQVRYGRPLAFNTTPIMKRVFGPRR